MRRWFAGLVVGAFLTAAGAAYAGTLPANFQETTVFSGLTKPTAVRFSPDGRVFVAEKSGLIKVFPSLTNPTPTVFADLRTAVQDYWDRGLLGLALDPGFPAKPYVYVLYTYDAAIGGAAPRWGDTCPTPPGATVDGCVVSGRLSRLTASGNVATGERVLIEDWCQQYPSHSIGDLHFGVDGMLYVSGGDGASFNFADWGQSGSPRNPCGDPPVPAGGTQAPPTAEGGALRAQSLERAPGEPVSLSGSILRVDPASGFAPLDNPLAGNPDADAARIVAQGFRNPFRFTIRPGTNEVWAGDVGWSTWEEIDRIPAPAGPFASNFGWPCYEGAGQMASYRSANLNVCNGLYGRAGSVVAPYYTYNHGAHIVASETCPTGSSSVTGMAFYSGSSYPASYNGALFFADHSRNCIWAMPAGSNGDPDPSKLLVFDAGAANPVDVEAGPGGDIFYADLEGGTIRRIHYLGSNAAPIAFATATPTSGTAPLTVNFDGSASSDPDPGDTITYAWDLNGDGIYTDSTVARPTYTYTRPGSYLVRLRVTDNHGVSTTSDPILIAASNTPPAPTISAPASSLTWKVGDTIAFSGRATDAQDGQLPASGLNWTLIVQHCPSNCHTHEIQTWAGVASGSFSAPDHDSPSYLTLQLTATDSNGSSTTTSVDLQPKTVDLTFNSSPSGLQLVVGPSTGTTRFTRTVIVGSANTVSATTPQTLGGASYDFSSWSDGGAQTHTIVAPAAPVAYTATYKAGTSPPPPPGLVAAYSFNEASGVAVRDASGKGNDGTAANAAWSIAGRNGGALSFNGASSWVTVPDAASLDLSTGMTLEAWAKPSALGAAWRGVLFKEQPGGMVYSLYANEDTGRPIGQVNIGGEQNARGAGGLTPNAWTHIAATYDGSTLRLYVNATQVGSLAVAGPIPASTGVLRIGGNSVWPEWFAGLLDDIRLYNRALSPAEIQNDMNTPVGPPAPDTSPPTVALTAPPAGSTLARSVTVSANASDNVAVAGVQFQVDGAPLGAEDTTAPYSITWDTATVGDGPHTLTAVARDGANNTATSAPVSVTVSNAAPPPPSGLVAAYGFNEGTGTAVGDASGKGNGGIAANTTWSTAGKFGGALSFNGTSSWVTVADSASLDLAMGMTLDAWVNPSALGGGSWRTILFKEQAGGMVYSMYAGEGTGFPVGQLNIGGERNAQGPAALPLNAWSHLAVTYDGTTLRLYVNATQAAAVAVGGAIPASTGPLRIGGNSVWPEWFSGLIDEVRVYNRALSATEIQADMGTAIT